MYYIISETYQRKRETERNFRQKSSYTLQNFILKNVAFKKKFYMFFFLFLLPTAKYNIYLVKLTGHIVLHLMRYTNKRSIERE